MTVKQARKQGLIFTGTYETGEDAQKAVEEAKCIRKLGFRAVTIQKDGGKSVYAEKAYMDYETAQVYKGRLKFIPLRKQQLLETYERELKELEAEEERYKLFIAKVEGKKV